MRTLIAYKNLGLIYLTLYSGLTKKMENFNLWIIKCCTGLRKIIKSYLAHRRVVLCNFYAGDIIAPFCFILCQPYCLPNVAA